MNRTTPPVVAVSRFLAWVAGALILASAVLVSVDVITRSIMRVTFLESFELSSYAFAAAVTLGLAYTLTSRTHIRIEVVYSLFRRPTRIALDLVAIFLLAFVAIALAWFAGQTVLFTFEMGARSNTSLGIPMVIPQGVWLAGLIWFALTAVWLAVRSVFHLLARRHNEVSREIGVLALHEEIEEEIEGITHRAHRFDEAPARS